MSAIKMPSHSQVLPGGRAALAARVHADGKRGFGFGPGAMPRAPMAQSARPRKAAGMSRQATSDDVQEKDELYILQQELLQEVEERKRLASKLIQKLKAEAQEKPDKPFTARPPPRQKREIKIPPRTVASASPIAPPATAPPPTKRKAAPLPSSLPPVGAPPGTAPRKAAAPKPASVPKSLEFPSAAPPQRPARAATAAAPPKTAKAAKAVPQAKPPPAPAPPAPLAGENVMKVVMVGAECAPWSKTGGLGDVMGALPKALAERGHRTMTVCPHYGNYEGVNDTGVRVRFRVFNSEHEVGYFHQYKDGVDYVFIDHSTFHGKGKEIYGGSRLDIAFRCALLCKAALEAPWHVPCGGIPYGDDNLVFIANDWHTALLPVYLEAHYRRYDQMKFARSMLVIHNMAHQGRGPFAELDNFEIPEDLRDIFFLDDPIGGEHMNIMKAGIMSAHRLVAVSHGYAWECQTQEGGWGLDSFLREVSWKFKGIVNGVGLDEWDPVSDTFLSEGGGYQTYDVTNFKEGKAACKAALQKELGLPVDPDVPLLGFIGRLDYQKGVDLIRDSYDWIIGEGCQLIMLGSGREDLENDLRQMESRNQKSCRAWVGFNVGVAHKITAACDILLMPSRFEPCGLNQLYAMHYGTIPVVHAVGGLRDTVMPYDPYANTGTGWTFDRAEAAPFREALGNALVTYRHHKESFASLQKRGMEMDLSWNVAAEQYEEVMVAAKYQW